jgi:hypothetical protein
VSAFAVRLATEADAPGIRALFARVFGKELPGEEWEWKYPRNPDGWLGTVAIIGNYSGCGTLYRLGGAERLAYAIGDVATDPAVRQLGGRRGVFAEMTAAFYAEVERRELPFCFGFPNDRALAISHRFAGTESLWPVVERRVPCAAFAEPPGGFSAGDTAPESFDALWLAASRSLPAAAVRDRGRVNWRFHARPTRYYRMVWREVAGAMTCWAALSVLGEEAVVAEYLGASPDGGDLPVLFAGAAAEAARLGAQRLVFWEAVGGPGAAAVRALPGASAPAGFTLIARVFDREAIGRFSAGHLSPALYDVV